MSEKTTAVYVWGGFSDGKLDFIDVDTRFGGVSCMRRVPALFAFKVDATKEYEDVRRVRITQPDGSPLNV